MTIYIQDPVLHFRGQSVPDFNICVQEAIQYSESALALPAQPS